MMSLFDLAEKRNAEISKEAGIGSLAAKAGSWGIKAIKNIGKGVIKNPGTAAGAALTGLGTASDIATGASMGAKARQAGKFSVSPFMATM